MNIFRSSSDARWYINGLKFILVNWMFFKKCHYILKKHRYVTILRKSNISFGRNVSLGRGSYISPIDLDVGDNTWIGINNVVCGKVKIGKDVHFAPNVVLPGASHNINDKPLSSSGSTVTGTVIKDYVWVGSNVTIVDGVTIGEGAIIAANSIVTKNVPANTIYGGVPAVKIRNRCPISQS